MSRNLLPRFQEDADVSRATPGHWMRIANPRDLTQLDFGDDEESLRVRIQSIPSPWARMILFKNALEDPAHPGRQMVQSEILDGLEFIWTLGTTGLRTKIERLDLDNIVEIARKTGSKRTMGFAEAVQSMAPEAVEGHSISILMLNDRPILASSPYTIFFTSEDAGRFVPANHFTFSEGSAYRSLKDRPESFQEYIARIIYPQIRQGSPSAPFFENLQRLVKPWLEREIALANQDKETSPDWKAAAEKLGLKPFHEFGGLQLFERETSAPITNSRWLLEPTREGVRPPLVVDPERFDGNYYDGSPKVTLPDLQGLPRDILPRVGRLYPWVCPQSDWFTDRLLLFNQPLDQDNVFGFRNYEGTTAEGSAMTHPRITLPLRPDFFRYFTPADVDDMLSMQVSADGSVEVSLRIRVGTAGKRRELEINRVYRDAEIDNGPGAELALWPGFEGPNWRDYLLLRMDNQEALADRYEISGIISGEELSPYNIVQRTPLVRSLAFQGRPEAIQLTNKSAVARGEDGALGVLLPRLSKPAEVTAAEWHVGIDFGTSNTVVSERKHGILDLSGLVLPLTEMPDARKRLMHGYFFPESIPAEPFGTAMLHLGSMKDFNIENSDQIELRANIPFTRYVDPHKANQVVGDLKWSHDSKMAFMSFSFLKQLVESILALAGKNGIQPQNITFYWSYPRAFTRTQQNRLEGLWKRVLNSLGHLGVAEEALADPYDESICVLNHFFKKGLVGTAGDSNVILDVGGGTTDIAAYGKGTVQILDSVTFGGRNLSGSGEQLFNGSTQNPFVRRFAAWAKENGLNRTDSEATNKYLDDQQDHLAFAYILSSSWIHSSDFLRYHDTEDYDRFKILILYFYAALFYYLGVSFRSVDGVPNTIVLAGNGSRYIEWLTDFTERGEHEFHEVLGKILRRAMRVEEDSKLFIRRSEDPKLEVALGLRNVAIKGVGSSTTLETANVVGEAVIAAVSADGTARSFDAEDRWNVNDALSPENLPNLEWVSTERMEIERLHELLVDEVAALKEYGAPWNGAQKELAGFFDTLDYEELKQVARQRIEVLSRAEEGFGRSILLLEANIVLERMLEVFYRPRS